MTNKIFTPDTLADGYETALIEGMERLLINYETKYRINLLRDEIPEMYSRLCIIAKEDGHASLMNAIRIVALSWENTSQLRDINMAKIPRYHVEKSRLASGWVYVDRVQQNTLSKLYPTEDEAKQALQQHLQHIADLQAKINPNP